VLAGPATDARALDPNRLPSQYVREQWTTETRFPGGTVNGIAQTADGYLWIGTDRGLIRFDGFNFRPVSFSSTTASGVPILQLLTDAGGKLWVRPQGADLVRQKDGKFESVRFGPDAITALSKDNHDGLLVSDLGQGTLRFMEDHVQKLGPASPPVISLAETADGKIWMGTLGDGLFFLRAGRATQVNAGLPDRKINCLLAIGSDELWVGTDTGLYRGNGAGFHRLELPSFLGDVQVLSILRDRDSNIWVGTTRGLLRINAKGISFSEENELRGDGGINVLFEDREGNLWIGGARGLGRIRDSAFVTYSSVSDRRFEHNGPVYVDPEGRTWLAPAQGGLYVLENGRVQPVTSAIPANEVVYSISGRADEVWVGRQRGGLTRLQFRNGAMGSQSYTEANGLAQNSAYAVYESRDGSVWAGTLNGGVSKFKDGRFTTYTTTNGLASNTISSILETRDGGMWFATPNGLSSFSNGQWRTYTTVEGLPSPGVNCLFEDSSGTLWSGTSVGLAFFASSHFKVPHESPDVLREQIVGMAEDKSGRFWIATSNHVLRVPRDKLLSGVVKAADVREYGQADGLESTEGVKRSRSVVSDSAGRIWFSLTSGLSVVNPSQIDDNSVPALPHIEAITADNNTANLAASVRIPPSPRRITFEYTGLSLAVPGRIRFRYFLEGFDSSWSQPVAAREAVYTNLGAGSYRFRLVASNSEGLWNGPEAAIGFEVEPTLSETWWFRSAMVLCVGLVALAAYLMRMRQLTRLLNARFEERFAERVRVARELHDTLLQSFQGLLLRFQTAYALFDTRPADAKEVLGSSIDQTAQAITEGREAVQGLRASTVESNDLAQAITTLGEQLAAEASSATSVGLHVEVEGTPRNLHPIARDEIYRIASEALRNAFRHAEAQQIEVEFRYDERQLRLRVRDDGKGIDASFLTAEGRTGHFGLHGMRERAKLMGGKLSVWTAAQSGAEIELIIPAAHAYAASPRRSWFAEKLSWKSVRSKS
jgi:signal transduction histidine kinase